MILFLSYWPNAAINGGRDKVDNLFTKNLWVMALSCLYCKQLNVPLIMHTNDLGYLYLKEFPYDSVLLTLNKIPENMSKRFFACSKFYAQLEMPLGAIHIDNDVFIKSKKCLEQLEFKESDLIVELKEFIDSIRNPVYYNTSNTMLSLFPETKIIYNIDGAYRCGIIGLNNQVLKNKYCQSYLDSVQILNNHSTIVNENINIVPDLILELSNLYTLSKNFNTKVLLPDYFPQLEHYSTYLKYAVEIGYHHLLGGIKWEDKILDQIKLIIYKLDLQLYRIVESLINLYNHEFNN